MTTTLLLAAIAFTPMSCIDSGPFITSGWVDCVSADGDQYAPLWSPIYTTDTSRVWLYESSGWYEASVEVARECRGITGDSEVVINDGQILLRIGAYGPWPSWLFVWRCG